VFERAPVRRRRSRISQAGATWPAPVLAGPVSHLEPEARADLDPNPPPPPRPGRTITRVGRRQRERPRVFRGQLAAGAACRSGYSLRVLVLRAPGTRRRATPGGAGARTAGHRAGLRETRCRPRRPRQLAHRLDLSQSLPVSYLDVRGSNTCCRCADRAQVRRRGRPAVYALAAFFIVDRVRRRVRASSVRVEQGWSCLDAVRHVFLALALRSSRYDPNAGTRPRRMRR